MHQLLMLPRANLETEVVLHARRAPLVLADSTDYARTFLSVVHRASRRGEGGKGEER